MGMEDGSGSAAFHNRQVQECFRTWFAAASQEVTIRIDSNQGLRFHQALIDPAWCHEQFKWFLIHHTAEISTGAIAPASAVNSRHHGAEFLAGDGPLVFLRRHRL
jgi:hypothetical protein